MVEFYIHRGLDVVVRDLYTPGHIGVVSLLNAIPVGFRSLLLEQLKDAPYERAPPFYKETHQDFFRFSSETHPIETLPESLGAIRELAQAHERLYREIGNIAGFESTARTTYNTHRYPGDSKGLGTHRDENKYRNLVAIYVLSGEREFIAARERNSAALDYIRNPPGSIILLRAPRNDQERSLRPFHAVQNVSAPTTIISFRHVRMPSTATNGRHSEHAQEPRINQATSGS